MTERVRLNVGGRKFETDKSALVGGSGYFAAMFSGGWKESADSTVFIDRCGDKFSHVLEVIRNGGLVDEDFPPSCRRELDFYQVAIRQESAFPRSIDGVGTVGRNYFQLANNKSRVRSNRSVVIVVLHTARAQIEIFYSGGGPNSRDPNEVDRIQLIQTGSLNLSERVVEFTAALRSNEREFVRTRKIEDYLLLVYFPERIATHPEVLAKFNFSTAAFSYYWNSVSFPSEGEWFLQWLLRCSICFDKK